MSAPFLTNIDLGYNQLKRGRLDNQAADPTGLALAQEGYAMFRTDTLVGEVWNGTAFDRLSGVVVQVAGTTASGTVQGVTATSAALGVGRQDQLVTISTTAATGAQAGSLAASDFTKLANSTATNTASTLISRDASGNFAAGVITASLTGTASNATNLNGQASTYYLARANHTGTQLAATISDFDNQVRTSRLDQLAVPTAPVAFNSQRATGLLDPVAAQDGATKNYVDSVASGLDVKASVRVASTVNVVVATGTLIAVDGVTVVAGDRVLLKNQTTASENGVYVASAGAWARSTDNNTSALMPSGAFVFTEQGTSQAATGWVLSTQSPITLGTTALVFTQFSGAGTYAAGLGLQLTGNSFSVLGTANRISVSGTGVDISAAYVGQASITTVGTIGTGIWQGTAVGVAFGGTGATTAAAARTNLGATTKITGTITGNGSLTSFSFTHNLATANHSLTMVDNAGNVTYADFALGANVDTIVTGQAIANGVVYTLIAVG